MHRGKSSGEPMSAMFRELRVELEVHDINGRRMVYAETWSAPEPLHLTTSTGSDVAGVRATVKITDPLKPGTPRRWPTFDEAVRMPRTLVELREFIAWIGCSECDAGAIDEDTLVSFINRWRAEPR